MPTPRQAQPSAYAPPSPAEAPSPPRRPSPLRIPSAEPQPEDTPPEVPVSTGAPPPPPSMMLASLPEDEALGGHAPPDVHTPRAPTDPEASAVGVGNDQEVGNLVALLRQQLQTQGSGPKFSPKTIKSVSSATRQSIARLSSLQRSRRTPGADGASPGPPAAGPLPLPASPAAPPARAAPRPSLPAAGVPSPLLGGDLAAPLDTLLQAREQGVGRFVSSRKLDTARPGLGEEGEAGAGGPRADVSTRAVAEALRAELLDVKRFHGGF